MSNSNDVKMFLEGCDWESLGLAPKKVITESVEDHYEEIYESDEIEAGFYDVDGELFFVNEDQEIFDVLSDEDDQIFVFHENYGLHQVFEDVDSLMFEEVDTDEFELLEEGLFGMTARRLFGPKNKKKYREREQDIPNDPSRISVRQDRISARNRLRSAANPLSRVGRLFGSSQPDDQRFAKKGNPFKKFLSGRPSEKGSEGFRRKSMQRRANDRKQGTGNIGDDY